MAAKQCEDDLYETEGGSSGVYGPNIYNTWLFNYLNAHCANYTQDDDGKFADYVRKMNVWIWNKGVWLVGLYMIVLHGE